MSDLETLERPERAFPQTPSSPIRLLMVSDAWTPQVNGVVRTLANVADELRAIGDTVEVIGPDRFPTMPMPSYP